MRKTLMKGGGAVAAVLAAMMVAGLIPPGGANAAHEPANKVSAAGSAREIIPPGTATPILSETVKTSKPTDLILGVTLECSITTEVTTEGNDDKLAFGQIRVWVSIDNSPYTAAVPVSNDDTTDVGRVVFCNRTYQRKTTQFDDEDAIIDTYEKTRSANGFNWMALNVGSGVHNIKVFAELTVDPTTPCADTVEGTMADGLRGASGRTCANGVIGNRTLVVEPVKAANDEAVTALG